MTTRLIKGNSLDVLRALPIESVHAIITSPPYFDKREYDLPKTLWPDGWRGVLGLERTPELYVKHLVDVLRDARRVLRSDGTLWLVIDDSHLYGTARGGIELKELIGIPWMVAFALRADGWRLRQDLIWYKPAPMPDNVNDRCNRAHEYVFLLCKGSDYYFDGYAIRDLVMPGDGNGQVNGFDASYGTHNKHSVWPVYKENYEDHYASFPPALVQPMILASTSAKGCCSRCGAPFVRMQRRISPIDGRELVVPASDRYARDADGKPLVGQNRIETNYRVRASFSAKHGLIRKIDAGWKQSCSCKNAKVRPALVLDPFGGSGTVGMVADRLGRDSVLIELNPKYAQKAERRLRRDSPLFAKVSTR